MRNNSFPGGIHPHERGSGKEVTGKMPIAWAQKPDMVAIMLSQHVGAPCKPLVKAGQRVYMGQMVGEPTGFMGAPVHASVSGVVKGIQQRTAANGAPCMAVVIENDGLDEWDPSIQPCEHPEELDKEEALKRIRNAGIVGMGGAAFPTSVKLAPSKPVDTVILNGAECEPYLTSDHRMMLERAEDICQGLKIAMRLLSAKQGVIAIEDNKPDAVESMQKAVQGMEGVRAQALPTKYPQGGEKQLIYAVTHRQVPSGGLPMDVGVVVMNVSTAAAVYSALKTGRPLIERVVTVTGEVNRPANLMVRIGVSVGSLINQCGGAKEGVNKLILGGPMMGMQAYSLETPVVKGTSGLLLMRDDTPEKPVGNCIRCANCVNACPIHLMPLNLYALYKRGRFERARNEHAMDCIECGCCSYICPSKLPLVQSIRAIKSELRKKSK